MADVVKVTFDGDVSGGTVFGFECEAGKPFDVPADSPFLSKMKNNPHFTVKIPRKRKVAKNG
jgi:hypothetical protein